MPGIIVHLPVGAWTAQVRCVAWNRVAMTLAVIAATMPMNPAQ
jgi:hypothetical protein